MGKSEKKEKTKRSKGCLTTIIVVAIFWIVISGGNSSNSEKSNKQNESVDVTTQATEEQTEQNVTEEVKQDATEAVDIEVLKQAIDEYLGYPSNKKALKVIKEFDKDLLMDELSKIILEATQKEYSADLSTFVTVRQCKDLYEQAFDESCPELDKNSELAEQLSDLYDEQRNLESLYPFNFEDGATGYQLVDVYVANRIEDKDAETITGKISQAANSHNAKQWKYYDSKDDSYWAAYNVEYNEFWGELPGEESYVILTNQTNPFSKPGVYRIAYYSDGRTITTISDKGFEAETPVLYLINEIQLLADWDTYKESKNQSENLLFEIAKLNGFKGDSLDKLDESQNIKSETAVTDSKIGYILPDSNSRYLTEADLQGLDQATLRLARNEIYARHGRAYETKDLNEYFSQQTWYHGYLSADEFDDSVLNEYEKANLELIKNMESPSVGLTIETPDILNTQWAMTPNEEYSFIIKGESVNNADVYIIETKNPDNIQYHGYVKNVTATEIADLYIEFGFGNSSEFAIVWNNLENIDFPKLEALGDYMKEFEGDYHYYGIVN